MLKRVADWIAQKRIDRDQAVMFEREVVLRFDDDYISSTYPDGTVQSIAWHEINRVAIETNDSGPWGADVWWLLEGADKRCVYPQGATGDPEGLNEYLKRLPEFSERAVIQAMDCTSNARFICWERRHVAHPIIQDDTFRST
jgi:hypothetical protein